MDLGTADMSASRVRMRVHPVTLSPPSPPGHFRKRRDTFGFIGDDGDDKHCHPPRARLGGQAISIPSMALPTAPCWAEG
jgi:hypothetical protein